MERSDRPGMLLATDAAAQSERAAALTDAAAILERAAADEAAANEARARFRREGLPTLLPDDRIAPLLDSGEHVVALRHGALLDRREPSPGTRSTPGVAGVLYVTSRRLVLVGRLTLAFELAAIEDAVVSGERLLLVLHGGHGVMLQLAQPRLLWVEIAAARGYARPTHGSRVGDSSLPAAR